MSAQADDFPAFPCGADVTQGRWAPHPGLTARDKFAMAAMQGDWASQSESSGHFSIEARVEDLNGRASLYYRMADAMLEVRGGA